MTVMTVIVVVMAGRGGNSDADGQGQDGGDDGDEEAPGGQESLSGLLLDALLMPVTVSGTQPALKKYLLNE